MFCDRCGVHIPEEERKTVQLNGLPVAYPFCGKCKEYLLKAIDEYPTPPQFSTRNRTRRIHAEYRMERSANSQNRRIA